MVEEFDVVIVGGGPAGSTAAYHCDGLRVLVVDKQEFPRHKACGGGLLNSHDWPQLFGNFRAIKHSLHTQPVERMVVYANTTFSFERRSHLFDQVERIEFDHVLLQEALKKENVQFARFEVKAIERTHNGLQLSDGHRRLAARYVVGADGWNSVVARHLGNKQLAPSQYGICLEYDLASDRADRHDEAAHVFMGFRREKGYAWIFPTTDGYYAGIGVVGKPRARLNETLDALVTLSTTNGTLPPDCTLRRRFSAPDPVYHADPYGDNSVLLAGDALGAVRQLSGEGIYFAMLSGKIAGQTLTRCANDPTTSSLEARYRVAVAPVIDEITLFRRLPPRWIAVPALNAYFSLVRHSRGLQDAFANAFCRRNNLPEGSHYIPFTS